MVDQLRFPHWFGPEPGEPACRRTCSAWRERRLVRPPLHRLQRLHAGARALLTGLYTHQTGCMITGGSTLEPGFPDVGLDAARARLPHLLVRQVASHPRRQQLDPGDGRARARALRVRRRHLPLARRRARAGLARGPGHRRPVRAVVLGRRGAPSRGARRCRSSTRTTSPGGTAGATACRRGLGAERRRRSCRRTSRPPSS